MLAVFVNCGTVILGSIIGLLFSKKFTDELLEMIQTACGVITLVIGFQMAFKYESIVYLALSLIIGAMIGYGSATSLRRKVDYTDATHLLVSSAMNGNTTDDNYMIPLYVVGYKTGTFN